MIDEICVCEIWAAFVIILFFPAPFSLSFSLNLFFVWFNLSIPLYIYPLLCSSQRCLEQCTNKKLHPQYGVPLTNKHPPHTHTHTLTLYILSSHAVVMWYTGHIYKIFVKNKTITKWEVLIIQSCKECEQVSRIRGGCWEQRERERDDMIDEIRYMLQRTHHWHAITLIWKQMQNSKLTYEEETKQKQKNNINKSDCSKSLWKCSYQNEWLWLWRVWPWW